MFNNSDVGEDCVMVGSELVLSNNAFAFERVLSSFEHSEEIVVITYSISTVSNSLKTGDDKTIDRLKMLRYPPKKITIVSNIPIATIDGIKNVDLYTEKLSPDLFPCETDIRFNFENHSKIIMTDKVAYVGSANFSLGSRRNWESGFITENSSDIRKIKAVAQQVINNSISIDDESYLFFRAKVEENRVNRIRLMHAIDDLIDGKQWDDVNEEEVQKYIPKLAGNHCELMKLVGHIKNGAQNHDLPSEAHSALICDFDLVQYCHEFIQSILNMSVFSIVKDHIEGNEINDIDECLRIKYESEAAEYKGNLYFLMEVCGIKLYEMISIMAPYRRTNISKVQDRYSTLEERFRKGRK